MSNRTPLTASQVRLALILALASGSTVAAASPAGAAAPILTLKPTAGPPTTKVLHALSE